MEKEIKNKQIWDKFLSNGEGLKATFSVSKRYRKFGMALWILVSIPLLFIQGLGVLTFLYALFYFGYYLKHFNNYALTDKRILIYKGWIHKQAICVDYEKITDIEIREPFIDRVMIKSGDILIDTAGLEEKKIILKHIDNPYKIKKQINELKNS